MSDETSGGSDDAAKPASRKGSRSSAAKSIAGKSGVAKPASKAKLAEREASGTPRPRSAKAQKAAEVQEAGTAKAGGLHAGEDVSEGGPPPEPTLGKGVPKPAASKADIEGKPGEGTSSATVGRAEMNEAAGVGATKTTSGRGRRKAEADASK